jgi:predicted AlkP superfamily phosphohydrolase/phosphomutase
MIALAALLVEAGPASAYVGPGAGFALLSSLSVVLVTTLIALASLLIWPFRTVWRMIRHRRKTKPLIRRLVVVGLDGQDPRLTDRFLKEGKLPNFAKLAEGGCYHRIRTTYPSVSPVAWSSFATGTNPGKHNIFDFLDRDRKTYLPVLSSTRIGKLEKFFKLGKWRIPLHKPELTLLRRSKPFWTLLGEANIWSTVLRVPITFPPDRFYGAQLGAMSIPDLLGTQGTFLHFTTRKSDGEFQEGGLTVALATNGAGPDTYDARIPGPENTFLESGDALEVPMTVRADRAGGKATLEVGKERLELAPGQLSDWVKLEFPAAPGIKVSGLVRIMLTELDEHVSLYFTPISIDPEKPAMPISHPGYYSTYLAKKIGPYSTLGLAEDTWALNEKVTDDSTFWRQSWDIDGERRKMFFNALDKLRAGSLTCVFDGTDRIQHMFWRYLEEGHPADPGGDSGYRDAIERLYVENDKLVGEVVEKLGEDDLLMVVSDHGFTSFRRGINLNRWLLDNGYLALKDGCDGSRDWLQDVDWSRTRAYSLGLCGMYLNVRGREAQGIVEPKEAKALKREIIGKMSGLRDEEKGEVAINDLFDTEEIYEGPYVRNAPDFIVGYNHGYRVSWDGATGIIDRPVFEDNVKAWSGDHGVDPRLVPGVFFCSRKIDREDPALWDIAPTALTLFGMKPPAHMEGSPMFEAGSLEAMKA